MDTKTDTCCYATTDSDMVLRSNSVWELTVTSAVRAGHLQRSTPLLPETPVPSLFIKLKLLHFSFSLIYLQHTLLQADHQAWRSHMTHLPISGAFAGAASDDYDPPVPEGTSTGGMVVCKPLSVLFLLGNAAWIRLGWMELTFMSPWPRHQVIYCWK